MKSAILIFPHQLFEHHSLLETELKTGKKIFLAEDPYFFTAFNYHKKKLVLHRASLKAYQAYLTALGHKVEYITYQHDPLDYIAKNDIQEILLIDPIEKPLKQRLDKSIYKHKLIVQYFQTPYFLTTSQERAMLLGSKSKKKYMLTSFYRAIRRYLGILVQDGRPIGGKWSFDTENRKKLPQEIEIPPLWKPRENNYVTEAIEYVEKHFPNNFGTTQDFFYPVTHQDARKWLENFLQQRLYNFGPYQDAINFEQPFLFHSGLSILLNTGLLTPKLVINQAIAYAQEHTIPIQSLEGFIRQVAGWREFVIALYERSYETQITSNYFGHTKPIPQSLWYGTTTITPVDASVKQLYTIAYTHHIERLMILGNFMLYCQIRPNEVYTWFRQLFIDAYDWVMVPNIYGMSQYADGGLMTNKPYICGSNYIKKLSNIPHGPWAQTWDALFWHFIYTHKNKLKQIPRLSAMLALLKKMKKATLEKHLELAQKFLSQLYHT